MDVVVIIIASIACILSGASLALIIIKSKEWGQTVNDQDLARIRTAVSESVNSLSTPVAGLITEKNANLMQTVIQNTEAINNKLDSFMASFETLNKNMNNFQVDLVKELHEFENNFNTKNLEEKNELMEKLSREMKSFNEEVTKTLDKFNESTKESIKSLSETVTTNLKEIREDNNQKLEKINESVNEKLQKTLEEKLQDSFKSVIEGIGSVNQAVGEIKGLATDVGSLKNVLTNVKTKGIVGEVILGNIIKEFLTTSQFEENVVTKKGSSERVEFAIKLPGTGSDTIFLPVDSKFPYEAYSTILESSDVEEIKNARKELRSNLLKYAKDVSDKYIDVPNTTDFAVIFLPLEGLYLEALNMGLFEEIQKKYKVNLTGPTTLTAFVNSLNMGFKSLMIQKKSADVFKLLAAVKAEFGKFADSLEKTQKKMNEANQELDTLVGTRTRMINSKLKNIEALNGEEAKLILESED